MKRALEKYILADLEKKIVLLTGPRQCGKTTLAKQLFESFDYFNYDSIDDRLSLKERSWDRKKPLIIFDELHKKKDWKQWLKGIFDTEGIPPKLMVTGSAKLDTYNKVGDSLAGRYFKFHLHPFDLKEAKQFSEIPEEELFQRLWDCSGFAEPFLNGDKTYYRRWRRSHLSIILRQDLIDHHSVRDIKSIETMVELLKDRVSGTISFANLARDLERDSTTIKRWLQMLENLYVIHRVTPYHNNIARSLLKEPKYYFYDHAYCENDEGARLENIVANALLKECHFIEDTLGLDAKLHYLRTKDGDEIDFLICIDGKPTHMIEVKSSSDDPAGAFRKFESVLPDVKKIQLVKELSREKTYPNGLEIRSLIPWLMNIELIEKR